MYNKKEKRSPLRALAEIISLIACALAIVGGIFWVKHSPELALLICIVTVLGAVAISIFTMLGLSTLEKKRRIHGPSGPVLGSIMYDVVNSAQEPALICDESKRIIWFNRFAQDASGVSGSLLGKSLSLIMQNPLPEDGDAPRDIIVTLMERTYSVDVTKINSSGKVYSLLIFRDITELTALKKFMSDDEKVIAYVIVDNLEELLQFEQENYREASGKIETEMRAWASSVNGIIKEYEKDKYIFIFRNEDLEKFIESKFDILDRIRNIRVGNGYVPVTISIGVAKITGTLADKERAAHVALDMALQRGGDQAVLKLDDND